MALDTSVIRQRREAQKQVEESAAQARKANEARYQQALQLYQQNVAMYQPGGGFGAGALEQYERTKTRDIAGAQQSLVSSGLYGTTLTAGLPKKYEEEVGRPFKLGLEDIRTQRLAGARREMAGLVERREDVPPDIGMYSQLMQQIGQAPAGGGMGGYTPGGRDAVPGGFDFRTGEGGAGPSWMEWGPQGGPPPSGGSGAITRGTRPPDQPTQWAPQVGTEYYGAGYKGPTGAEGPLALGEGLPREEFREEFDEKDPLLLGKGPVDESQYYSYYSREKTEEMGLPSYEDYFREWLKKTGYRK